MLEHAYRIEQRDEDASAPLEDPLKTLARQLIEFYRRMDSLNRGGIGPDATR